MALGDDGLARAVIMDPRAIAARWPEPRVRMIAELATLVTETPWRLSREWRARAARDAALEDDAILHVVALSAYFGHLNRIADAVGVDLDYVVRYAAPHAVPTTPRYEHAPGFVEPPHGVGALALAQRPSTANALAAWRDYVMERDAPLSRGERAGIDARVGGLLGATPASAEGEYQELADVVTLAPWALGPDAFAAMRATGADDARVFDVVVVASTAGTIHRIAVALAALGR